MPSPTEGRASWMLALVLLAAVVLGASLLLASRVELSSRGADQERGEQTLRVAATIHPLFDIARQIAGEDADVLRILPPGASPHTYELTPSTLRDLSEVEAVFAIGHGLDDWVTRASDNIGDLDIVTVDRGIALRAYEHEDGHASELADEDEEEHEHEHGGRDPHYWLSIENAAQIAETITDTLASYDPVNEEAYWMRLEVFLDSLQALKAERVAGGGQRDLLEGVQALALHDGWAYFADDLGFRVVATVELSPGREPTPRHVESILALIDENQIDVIISEPQLSASTLLAITREGGLPVVELDPLGGSPGRETYQELLRFNREALVGAVTAQ